MPIARTPQDASMRPVTVRSRPETTRLDLYIDPAQLPRTIETLLDADGAERPADGGYYVSVRTEAPEGAEAVAVLTSRGLDPTLTLDGSDIAIASLPEALVPGTYRYTLVEVPADEGARVAYLRVGVLTVLEAPEDDGFDG